MVTRSDEKKIGCSHIELKDSMLWEQAKRLS